MKEEVYFTDKLCQVCLYLYANQDKKLYGHLIYRSNKWMSSFSFLHHLLKRLHDKNVISYTCEFKGKKKKIIHIVDKKFFECVDYAYRKVKGVQK